MKQYDLPKRLAAQAMDQADRELRAQHAKGIFDEGDPNHPKYNNGVNYALPMIFGYDQKSFLQRQYK